jgi:SpoVK/Ycf46/Vps4 family AAA+-type ATPase
MIYGRKPVMSPELDRQILNAVAQFKERKKWKQWGLHNLREQGAAILLEGPAGCGKTVIAEYLALKIRRKGIKKVSMADFGSGDPGGSTRALREIFKEANDNGGMTIFFDECDSILIDRSRLSGDMVWIIDIVNELLTLISSYRFLIVLATNRPQILDRALYRRLLAIITVPVPERPEREKLWRMKIPEAYPIKLDQRQVEQIATLQITGSEIETVIINVSSDCLRSSKKPTYKQLFAEAEHAAKIRKERDEYEPAHPES